MQPTDNNTEFPPHTDERETSVKAEQLRCMQIEAAFKSSYSRRTVAKLFSLPIIAWLFPGRLFGDETSSLKRSVFYPNPQKEVVTEEIERVVEKQVYKPLLTFNAGYIEPEPSGLIGLSPSYCPACPAAKVRLGSTVIQWQNREMKGCPSYPAVYDPVSRAFYTGSALNSLESLQAAVQHHMQQKGLPMRYSDYDRVYATVDPSYLKMARDYLGESGTISRKNILQSFDFGLAALRLPALLSGGWSTNGDETIIKFTQKPILRVKIVDQAISGFVITDNSIRLNIDWFPDITLQVEGTQYEPPKMKMRNGYPRKGGDWSASGDMGQHLIHGHHQPVDKVNDLTEDEKMGLHHDCHQNQVKQFILVPIPSTDWA